MEKKTKKLLCNNDYEEGLYYEPKSPSFSQRVLAWVIVSLIAALIVFGLTSLAHAQEPTDAQVAAAIFKAEGGDHARYLYGIRSVHYKTKDEARQICLRTIRNNRRRYRQYGYLRAPRFIEFLQQVYCPNTPRYPDQGKRWLKNVEYFIKREKA